VRILFLAPQPFFEVRGTPLAVLHLTKTLGSLGHEVDLLTFPRGKAVPIDGVRHLRSLPLPVGRVKAGPSLAKMALDVPFAAEAAARIALGRYDVVHAVEEAAHLAAPFTRLLGVPLVMDVDSLIPDQLRYSGFATRGPILWLAETLEQSALRQAAAVVTVCTSLTESVRARRADAAVYQIEDPPLTDHAHLPGGDAVATLRRELSLPPGPVVLYSGNFEPYQGVDLLVDAMAEVEGARAVFMGGEPHEIAELKARAREKGAAERCVFAGKRPPSELPVFLAAADVLASPRRKGTNTPFKLYTYLASGRPIVATRILSHTQVIDEKTAFLVDPTPEALAAGLRAALEQPDEARARAERGLDLVEREYSEARYREKVERAYAAVAEIVAHAKGQ